MFELTSMMNTVLSLPEKTDPPPLKWSDLHYVF